MTEPDLFLTPPHWKIALCGGTIARRCDLRWPLPQDFAARLEGQTVLGLGRRGKYVLADLSSGDVLLMHLGMSGSFRVAQEKGEKTPGDFHHPRSDDRA